MDAVSAAATHAPLGRAPAAPAASAIAPGPTVAAFAAALGEELHAVEAALNALQDRFRQLGVQSGSVSLLALEAAVQVVHLLYAPSLASTNIDGYALHRSHMACRRVPLE